jgi:multisubunit Na+/H+ antiporter MnhC subunit
MFKNHKIGAYIKYSVLAALLFCITVFIFLRDSTFTGTWWLYVGNALFGVAIALFVLWFNKTKREDASTSSLVVAGHITTVIGIIISCIVSYLLLIMFVPGLFQGGEADVAAEGAPATVDTGKTDGLVFMIFMNAIVGNVAVGSFVALLLPYSAKRNQTKDSAEIKYKIPE